MEDTERILLQFIDKRNKKTETKEKSFKMAFLLKQTSEELNHMLLYTLKTKSQINIEKKSNS